MIWFVFALLTGAAVFSILWPLSRPAPKPSEDAADVAFYRAQIAEIDAERARGAIDREQAESAKALAARRLLASAPQDDASKEEARAPASGKRKWAAALALVAIPAIALGLYARLGHPDEPDMPLEARLKGMPTKTDFAAAVAKMEEHIAAHPDDGKALELMAPVYLRMGRYPEAIHANEEALRLLGPTPDRHLRLAEALATANEGALPPKAVEHIEKALELDPKSVEARYFLGVAAAQAGDAGKARDLWRALASDLPTGSRQREAVEDKIAQLDAPPQASPDSELAQSVARQAPDEQQKTIQSMVAGLAARLAEKGGRVEEWTRLIRAYKVLNESDKAVAALANARKAYAGDAGALEQIDAQAQDLGLEGK
jgi:cytochrome c-type biogenesis protein CcmH